MEAIGPFRLEAELGRGAMGVVFRGFDPAIGRQVAIKIINIREFTSDLESAETRLRFQREAAAAGKLSHPNIVTIYQLGEDGDRQYLVMELVNGDPLDRVLAERGFLAPEAALPLLRQMADALDYAHSQGIVHRDIKPANILVSPGGKVKITDFGIARISSQTMTQTGMSVGTPAYMAPEQIMSGRVSGKADQFSLAVMAYQMLCGRMPFIAETHPALIYKIVSEEPIPVHTVNPRVPARASEILRRAMAKDPDKRLPTCSEFVGLLAATLTQPAVTVAATGTIPAPTLPKVANRRRGVTLVVASCVVLLLIVVAALKVMRQSARDPTPTPLRTPAARTVPPATKHRGEGGRRQPTDLDSLRAAAEAGSVPAMEQVALMYERGRGVTQNYGEAVAWYRLAADAGSRAAMNSLGLIYDQGRGLPADYGEAMKWYRKAADAGEGTAMYNVGALYEAGKGVDKDLAQARDWYRKAAGEGVPSARVALRRLGAATP